MKRNQIQTWTTKANKKEEQNRSSRPGEENKIATDVSKTQTKKLKSNRKTKIQKNRENEKEPKRQRTLSPMENKGEDVESYKT